MRRIGLLAGMSWESGIEYERLINQRVREELGGVASADLIIRSFNFADIAELQSTGQWDAASALLASAAADLERAGAEAIAICTNTMHLSAPQVREAISVPLLHIGDAAGTALVASGIYNVALLGTKYTMEMPFLIDHLRDEYGLTVSVPESDERELIQRVIYDELVQGVIRDESRAEIVAIVDRMFASGCQGVIAGCTEIELLLRPSDISVPMFPTARLHAEAIAAFALAN